MPTPPIFSYADVLAELEAGRHLLLGNGFSIACRPDLFRYDTLFNRADFSELARARASFDVLGTTNFETVIRAISSFALLASVYAPGDEAALANATADANALREVLVSAVADSHPERPHFLAAGEYLKCRQFLRGYRSINTLNYDLLLYWTLMQDELGDQEIPCDDGFRKPADDPDADYVS